MSKYVITYKDSVDTDRTLELLLGDDGVQSELNTALNRNKTSTGRYETVVQHTSRMIEFDCYFNEATKYKVETWLSFAQQGRTFSFNKCSDRIIRHHTLNGAVSAGSTLLNLNGIPNEFSVGDHIWMQDSESVKFEVCTVETVGATSVTLETPLNYGWEDITPVPWYFYYNDLLLLDEDFKPSKDGSLYHHTFNCVEVR